MIILFNQDENFVQIDGKKYFQVPMYEPKAGETVCGYGCDGVNVWGDEKSMKAVRNAFHSIDVANSLRETIIQERAAHAAFKGRVNKLIRDLQS